MKKKEITYTGLVKVMMAKARKEMSASGKSFDTKSAFSSAAARWKLVKDGSDPEFLQGKTVPGLKRTSKKQKGMKKESDPECESKSQFKINDELLNKVELFKYIPVEIAAHPGARSFTTKTAIQKNAFMGSKEACRCNCRTKPSSASNR